MLPLGMSRLLSQSFFFFKEETQEIELIMSNSVEFGGGELFPVSLNGRMVCKFDGDSVKKLRIEDFCLFNKHISSLFFGFSLLYLSNKFSAI